jgi:hypothetical protein
MATKIDRTSGKSVKKLSFRVSPSFYAEYKRMSRIVTKSWRGLNTYGVTHLEEGLDRDYRRLLGKLPEAAQSQRQWVYEKTIQLSDGKLQWVGEAVGKRYHNDFVTGYNSRFRREELSLEKLVHSFCEQHNLDGQQRHDLNVWLINARFDHYLSKVGI